MPRLPAEVRRAGVDDIDDVLTLWRQAREELDRAGRQIASTEQVRPRLLDAMASGDVEVVIARWDGRPAGFLIMRIAPLTLLVETPSVHLEQLFVVPELRRHGIARALLNGVVARADRTCAEQVVTSVMPWARDTHRFFARLGFTPLVVRRAVSTSVLRRRLAGESPRSALEDLLSRRRSLRARSRLLPAAPAEAPCGTAPGDAEASTLDLAEAGGDGHGDGHGDLAVGLDAHLGVDLGRDLAVDLGADRAAKAAPEGRPEGRSEGRSEGETSGALTLPEDRPAHRVASSPVGGAP